MGFTLEQRMSVIGRLKQFGWKYDGDTVTAPSGGIWLSVSHFVVSPEEMTEAIKRRGHRISQMNRKNSDGFAAEHFQICRAIEETR